MSGAVLLSLERIRFDFDPFPIGYATDVLPIDVYRELAASYPPLELFRSMPVHGKKYSLSELNHPDEYRSFLRRVPVWGRLHAEVKAPAFVARVVDLLLRHGIDLGLEGRHVVVNRRRAALLERCRSALELLRAGRTSRVPLRSRFEFSMLPADGGCIRPHTDSPGKLVTLVLSMLSEPWPPEYGGGTEVLRPLDVRRSFNQENAYLEFDQVESLRAYPFVPNQCVVFVKTFNSLHAVSPMTGAGSPAMRKTLTINIETA